MKEKDVETLAALLKKTPEEVNTAIENGGISEFIETYESSHEVYTKEDFNTFKSNFEAQVEQKWLDTKVPKRVYDKIKGISYEVIEKEIAEKHGVDAWKGMDDLVAKISNNSAKNPEDTTKLKDQIDRIVAEHKQEMEAKSRENDTRFIDLQLNQLVSAIPIDAEGRVLETQRKMLKTMIKSEFDFSVEADALKITNAPVDFVQKNLDPMPPIEVMTNFAKDYVNLSSGGGGRGDISSTAKTTRVNLPDYCKKNGIMVNSPEHAEALKKFKEAGVIIDY